MSKFSLITLVLVASLSSTLLAQDCNNPLLPIYGLQGLDSPQAGSDLPYCVNLRDADTCCSADTVASFQERADDLIDRLNNYAAAKDLYLAQLRDSFFDRFKDILSDISDDHQDDLRDIRRDNVTIADQLQAEIDSSNQTANDAREINNQFVGALDDYQRARSNCFTTALEVQASSWCLACDPNYASQGVSEDGNVVFSEGLCQAISDACSPFFTQGARFNPLIRAREAYSRLVAVSRYLKDFSDNEVITDLVFPEDSYNPLPSQQEVVVPDQAAANSGQCQDLWSGDARLRELLTVGATVPAQPESRLLQEASDVWGPDLTATGLNFDALRLDPGDFFQASDYSDYFKQTQNASDQTDTDDDHTDHDLFVRSDSD